MKTKRCSKCKEIRSENEFHKNRKYLSSRCIYCKSKKTKEEYLLEKENIKNFLKKCGRCKEWKIYDMFSSDKSRSDNLDGLCRECRKYYIEINKEKINEKNKIYREENIEKEKIRSINFQNSLVKFNSKYTKHLIKYNYEVQNNGEYLEIKCKNCHKFFISTNRQVASRIQAIKGSYSLGSENHLYCSEECKGSCGLFKRRVDPKDLKINNSNNPEWVKIVLENANYECEICGSIEKLNAHHIIPVSINPLLAEDIDNGVCLCKKCHYEIVHKLPGCSLGYLRKISCINNNIREVV
jgi:hypothetical protein